MKRLFIITAVSDKNHHWCVSGVCIQNSKHYRLVSEDSSIEGAIHKEYLRYVNKQAVLPLDLVEFEVIRSLPQYFQPENIVIDEKIPPKFVSKASLKDLVKYTTNFDNVLFDNRRFIDPKNFNKNQTINRSLELISIDELRISHVKYENKSKIYGYFSYKGIQYKKISITDPKVKKVIFEKDEGNYHVVKCIILVSLGEEFDLDGYRYKLIACIHK